MKSFFIHSVIPVFILCLFALLLLVGVCFGAVSFKEVSEYADASYTARTATGYVQTKLWNTKDKDKIRLENFGGSLTIRIDSVENGLDCTLRIYSRDGQLWELFTPADVTLSPEDGQRVTDCDSLFARIEKNCIFIEMEFGNDSRKLVFPLKQRWEENYR